MNSSEETLCPGCFQKKPPAAICPQCGYDESEPRSPLALPHRTLLQGQYRIGRVLGKPGGFGITYLALDTGLATRVAIKEYLPRDLAGRAAGSLTIRAHSREDGELFRFGLEQFLNEARTLARFDHAHVVRVRHVFEENGTACLVMDYYEGMTLGEYLHRNGRLPEKTALDILMPILDGLREVHEKGFIHRDIKPQNIYLTRQGRPILLDFGAARMAMAERSRSLSVVLTPGYAPFEQYHRKGEQGPWTDVYACAAVLYQMVTGEVPPDAPERAGGDGLVPPNALAPGIPAEMNEAILLGMAMDSRDRPQSIGSFQERLLGGSRKPRGAGRELRREKPEPVHPEPKKRNAGIPVFAAIFVLIAAAAGAYFEMERRAEVTRLTAEMNRRKLEAEQRIAEAERYAQEVAEEARRAEVQRIVEAKTAAGAARKAELESTRRRIERLESRLNAEGTSGGGTARYPTIPHPSFDCRKAGTYVEREICRNPALAQLDAELGRAYRSARRALSKSAANRLRREQRDWLNGRDNYLTRWCSGSGHIDTSCARDFWEQRIAEIYRWME